MSELEKAESLFEAYCKGMQEENEDLKANAVDGLKNLHISVISDMEQHLKTEIDNRIEFYEEMELHMPLRSTDKDSLKILNIKKESQLLKIAMLNFYLIDQHEQSV